VDDDISRNLNLSNKNNIVNNMIERYKREIENKSENEVLFKYNPKNDIKKNTNINKYDGNLFCFILFFLFYCIFKF
jgi:hypothetical protein